MLRRLHDQVEEGLDHENEEVVLDTLVEVFDVVHLVLALGLLEVLHDDRWVQNFFILIPEQVEKKITGDSKVKLVAEVRVGEPVRFLIEASDKLDLKVTFNVFLPSLVEKTWAGWHTGMLFNVVFNVVTEVAGKSSLPFGAHSVNDVVHALGMWNFNFHGVVLSRVVIALRKLRHVV